MTKRLGVEELSIRANCTIKEALQKMDSVNKRLLIVLDDEGAFNSLLSLGDIQRSLLKFQNFDEKVVNLIRPDVIVANSSDSEEEIKVMMLKYRIEYMPVIHLKKVVKIIFWDDLFEKKQNIHKGQIDLPVVIMAGGEGTRLRPITYIIPKPLVPVGEKPIIERIVDNFVGAGCTDFHFSVNYRANMIKAYFEDVGSENYSINYFTEDKPLGTAGSLSLLKEELKTTFFVSNCDIIIEQDYNEILDYHKANKNELTAVAFVKGLQIPYGTFEVKEDGLLESLVEKPDFTFLVNAGMYILEPHLLDEIPSDSLFHITHLMENILKRQGRVGVFPISEGSWLDIGQWKEYQKTLQRYGSEITL